MATTLYMHKSGTPGANMSTDYLRLDGVAAAWKAYRICNTTRGSSLTSEVLHLFVDGPTAGIELGSTDTDGAPYSYISPPIAADVTVSGTMSFSQYCYESNMAANAAAAFAVYVLRADTLNTRDGNTRELIYFGKDDAEMGTTGANMTWTGTPTSTDLRRGDRIVVNPAADDAAANMSSGGGTYTWAYYMDSPTAGGSGDTWVQFTETITFETDGGTPTGTTIYLTNTASDVNAGTVELEAWTSRGGGVVSKVTNTATGWTAPIQCTDGGGGTVIEWYTKQLQAFTLGGVAKVNFRAAESSTGDSVQCRAQIAVVNSDGTSPVIWGDWVAGAFSSAEANRAIWVSGRDISVSNGQRLRIRAYIDDMYTKAMVGSRTLTLYYNGTSGGASGDAYVILPQSVSEYVPGATEDPMPYVSVGGYYPTQG